MTSAFLVGPQGYGKATLLAGYQARFGKTNVIDVVFEGNSMQGIKRQESEEKQLKDQPYISRGSILDALVGAIQNNQVDVPNYPPQLSDGEAHRLLAGLFNRPGNGISGQEAVEAARDVLQRHRQSLNVLVHPFQGHSAGANIEVDPCMTRYQQVFHLLRIPFIELKETEVAARVEFLGRAIRDHTIPSPLASLQYFETLSSKPKKAKKGVRCKSDNILSKQDLMKSFYSDINLPFFRTRKVGGSRRKAKGRAGDDSDDALYALNCLKISEKDVELTIEERPEGLTNRFLQRRGGSHGLFLVHFDMGIPSDTVLEILHGGLYIQGDLYSFLGCSSSGLKARKCYLLKGTARGAQNEREQWGDFAALKTISKQIARFSLLLTNVVPTTVIPPKIKKERDVELDGGSNFTDGCGCISPDLANQLYRETKTALSRRGQKNGGACSVVQIRFQGYKGVVTRDSKLEPGTIVVRDSMEKFHTEAFPNICVCECSRPYSFGHLNRQFIMLLSGLGIPDEVFEQLQTEHFDRVRRLLYDRDSAIMIYEWKNRADEFVEEDQGSSSGQAETGGVSPISIPDDDLKETQKRLTKESPKLKILIPESRTLFGVAETPRYDEAGSRSKGILQPGECLVRLTMGGKHISLQNKKVVVSKNPCYLSGDIRVLRAVSSIERPALKELERDLVDCIVFPIEGVRSHSEEIAGSDLDGDKYFVCWDERLVPSSTTPAYDYPAYSGRAMSDKAGDKSLEMIRYFAAQNKATMLTGKVNNLFCTWADLEGVTSEQCVRLGQLFSRVVDSAKSGERIKIEDGLVIDRDSKPIASADSKYIWQRMEFAAGLFVEEQMKKGNFTPTDTDQQDLNAQVASDDDVVLDTDAHDGETFLFDLLSRNHLVMSEFTKFCLIMQFLGNDVNSFFRSTFSGLVNFGLFSLEERGFAIQKYGVPISVLQNPIKHYSSIVGYRTKFLDKFLLHGEIPWRFYWRGENEGSLLRFPSLIAHALRHNTDALMIMQLPDSVVILLRFSRDTLKQELKDRLLAETDGNGCSGQELMGFLNIKAVLISGHFGLVENYDLADPKYKIDLDERGMQIYRGQPSQTFVHVKILRSASNGSKDSVDHGQVPRLQISVDLRRFISRRALLDGPRRHPLVRKCPVFDMELFVTNKRSDHSSYPARISHLDVLLETNEPWTNASFSHDHLLEDGDSDDEILQHLRTRAECIVKVILDQCADLEHFLSRPDDALSVFRSEILEPAHHLFGVATSIPAILKEHIASLSMEIFVKVLPEVEFDAREAITMDLLAMLSDLDIDILWGLPELSVADSHDTRSFVSSFIQVIGNWKLWLAFEASQKRKVLEWLESAAVCTTGDTRAAFAVRNASEQARVLLEELHNGSEATRSSAGISRLSNLRMDPAADRDKPRGENRTKGKKKLPTVSLYCVQALPTTIRFATGEYVCISRQVASNTKQSEAPDNQTSSWSDNYDQEFPSLDDSGGSTPHNGQTDCSKLVSKRGGLCFGRVVSVCDAPFSIKVKLEASSYAPHSGTPELISQCLQARTCIYWELSMVPANVVTHQRNVDAIGAFFETSTEAQHRVVAPEILPYLMPGCALTTEDAPPFPDKEPRFKEDLAKLNARQQDAVRQSLECRVSLVHGPPGTGKSTTAVHIMREILSASEDRRVLVCAETNLAVDNLALKLTRGGYVPSGQAIRVGGQDKVHPDLEAIHLESLVKGKRLPNKKSFFTSTETDFFLSKYKKIIGDVLRGARIVFTTCAGAGDPNLNGQTFKSVLMDEASMTTEPGALCPLAHGCCHLVLIGDHKQLGPHALGGQCISLFERLTDSSRSGDGDDGSGSLPAAMTMLNQQHRMHPQLCRFPSNTFYNGQLRTAPGIAEARPLPKGFVNQIRFVQVENGREERFKSGSWFNDKEVETVLEILKELVQKGNDISSADITVLTPYRAQQARLQVQLKNRWNNMDPPEVCSVDGFQGREKEIIVVSTVRCGPSLGFCDDAQRVNVLLTRAKRGLIVLGDSDTLKRSSLWSTWLQQETP